MPGTIDPDRRVCSALPRRPALTAVICFILGIALHGRLPHYPQLWLVLVGLLVVCGIFVRTRRICDVLMMLGLVCSGAAISQIEAFYYPRDDISAYATDD